MKEKQHTAAATPSIHSFISADRPIESASEDRLKRSRFADQLADVLGQWRQQDSLVVGLFGPWGSGKTSIKNLVIERLKGSRDAPEIIEFNPWQWSGHEQLAAAFFKEIQKKLGRKDASQQAHKVAKLMKSYSAFLGVTKEVLGVTPKSIQIILVLLTLAGVSPTMFERLAPYGPAIGMTVVVFALLTLLISHSQTVLDAIARWKEARAELDKKTLIEVKSALAEALRKLDRSLLVVIDDLDRLEERDVREVFQLVKANADFPNFVYLLPFQRSAATAFKDLNDDTGEAFLGKIIQIPFDVPMPQRSDIDAILTERLNVIFGKEMERQRFSHERWFNIFQGGLQNYFTNLRDVNRFVGSLSFYAGLFRSQGLLEVNPVDLVALEVARIFEPKLYRRLAASKELLTGTVQPDGRQRDVVKEQIVALVNEAPQERQAQLKAVLRILFPNREWAFGGPSYAAEFYERWQSELQVCCKEMFDRYFALQIAPDDISQAELEAVLATTQDAGQFEAMLRSFADGSRLMRLLDMLELNLARINVADLPTIVPALASIGERLPEEEPGFFSIPPVWTLSRILRRLLLRESSEERRAQVLLDSIAQSTGLSALIGLVASEQTRHEKKDGQELLVSSDHLNGLRTASVARLRQAAQDGSLLSQRELAHLLYKWKSWANEGEVRGWTMAAVNADMALGAILRAFTHRSVAQGFGDQFIRISWFIRLNEFAEFVDLPNIEERVATMVVPENDVATARAVTAFKEAVSRRREGQPDEPG